MNSPTSTSNTWRKRIIWSLCLLATVAIVELSYGLAEYVVLDRIVPNFPEYTDEDTAKIFGPLYGYDAEITQYAAHPLAVAINSTIDAMREDVETRSKDLLDEVYTTVEVVLLVLTCVYAIFAARSSSSRKQRYIALGLIIFSVVALLVLIIDLFA